MAKNNLDKRKSERAHAKRRAKSRYALDFTKEIRNLFIRKIQSNEAKFLSKQSRRVSLFSLDHEEQKYVVVYDRQRGEIVTFLPADANNNIDGSAPWLK